MDIVLMNLKCSFLSVCYVPCSRAEGRSPVPYRFFSHFLAIGLSEMESKGYFVFLLLITGCFKENKERAGHLIFLFLMTGLFRVAEECNCRLVFLILKTGSFKDDKECPGHLVYLILKVH